MNRAWTGGQYSLVRAIAGATLAWCLLGGAFGSGELRLLPALLSVAALAVTIGAADRGAAFLLAFFFLVSCSTQAALGPTLAWTATAWLLAHSALPPAPYGSFAARGRDNPDGGWTMPDWFPAACWGLFVATRLTFAARAFVDGHWPVAIVLFALGIFALSPRMAVTPASRLSLWAVSLGFELACGIVGDGHMGSALVIHVLAFQPLWLSPREQRQTNGRPPTVFYDGSCALCHGAVRFLLAEDLSPPRFRIAPIGGETFLALLDENTRAALPDSIVLVDDEAPAQMRGARLLVRSDAVVEILDAIGGWWRIVALAMRLVPRALRDAVYDHIAARRYAWFGRKPAVCTVPDPERRARLDP